MNLAALEVVKDLRRAFSGRGITCHAADAEIRVHQADAHRVFVVLDPEMSRHLLVSKSVRNNNYFADSYAQLAGQERSLPAVADYFQRSPLFQEGSRHRQLRATMLPMILKTCDHLREQESRIVEQACRRLIQASSPIQLATQVVNRCFVVAICHLVDVPVANALRAIRGRASVFNFHFHPVRHQRMNQALDALSRGVDIPEDESTRLRWNLAQSLLVMGVDPCIATIIAAVVDRYPGRFSDGIQRYIPTSFVSRLCVDAVEVGPHQAQPGDVIYLSLLGPDSKASTSDPQTRQSRQIPFGAGPHVCLGKPLSQVVCDIGEKVFRKLTSSGVCFDPLTARGDGAFLNFPPGANAP